MTHGGVVTALPGVTRRVLILGLALLGCGSRTGLDVSRGDVSGGDDAGQDAPSEDAGGGGSSSGEGVSSSPCLNPVNGQWLTGATATEYCPSCPADHPVPCCVGELVDVPDGAQEPVGVCNCCLALVHCTIDGQFYPSGAGNPNQPCQACEPATSTSGWTDLENGSECRNGVCCAGMCVGESPVDCGG